MFASLAKEWVLSRLKEPSTYAGLTTEILLAIHYTPNADFKIALTQLLAALGGLVVIVMKEGAGK